MGPNEAPTPQYSSPKGQRTEGPLRRAAPSSFTAAISTSTFTTTTKKKVNEQQNSKITTSELSTHSMLVPSITMTLLYIGMGVDGNFPQAPSGYFLPSPRWTRYLQETPQAHTKAHYLLHGLGHSPNRALRRDGLRMMAS
jgi:hypothetical protein